MNCSARRYLMVDLLVALVLLVGCGPSRAGTTDQPSASPARPAPSATARGPTPVQVPTVPALARARDYWPTEDWRAASPETQGMDGQVLANMSRFVEQEWPHIHGILVVRHGYLVFERYYQGYDRSSYHQIQSTVKSFISALAGIALQQGKLKSLDQRIGDFFPEYIGPNTDPRLREITVEHLLTMTAGFEYCPMLACLPPDEADPIRAALAVPLTARPGERFQYNTPAVTPLLVELLARATGTNTWTFAAKNLCEPLGMLASCEQFRKDSTFRPRDMAKFGYLYLNQGSWDSRQIIPPEWVRVSTERHSAGGPPSDDGYGYLFWVTQVRGHAAYYAAGQGGQYVYVVPDLDLVVVITSSTSDGDHPANRELVTSFILQAIKE